MRAKATLLPLKARGAAAEEGDLLRLGIAR
jgi:hypothetical protein